jgi:hypothetical protein
MRSGFGAFYHDYDPEGFLAAHSTNKDFVLHNQVRVKFNSIQRVICVELDVTKLS